MTPTSFSQTQVSLSFPKTTKPTFLLSRFVIKPQFSGYPAP
ncbi:MAG: hypothetical protein JWQ38_850 [Flavipsychrobacter sp.]|nr:hypothetical protein [Flavipsychrobacter sp.]